MKKPMKKSQLLKIIRESIDELNRQKPQGPGGPKSSTHDVKCDCGKGVECDGVWDDLSHTFDCTCCPTKAPDGLNEEGGHTQIWCSCADGEKCRGTYHTSWGGFGTPTVDCSCCSDGKWEDKA